MSVPVAARATAAPDAATFDPVTELRARPFDGAVAVLRDAIRSGGRVLCIGHIQPDGDALGSALALALAIRAAGGEAVVSFDPGPLPFGLPVSLAFLPDTGLLVAPSELRLDEHVPALVVTFDTGSQERLGVLAEAAECRPGGPPVLVIDHHARGAAFGSVRLIDPHAAATAEMVARLIDALGVCLDAELATCLYAGLASDTGSFRYAATTPETHHLAARLLAAGAPSAAISRALWDTRPASYLPVLAGALERVRRSGEIIWTYVTREHLAAHGASAEETEGIVDVIRSAQEFEVAVVLKQDVRPDHWKVSVRSRGRVDVGAACAALGGGGHRLAAGFSAGGEPETIVARLRAVLPDDVH